MNKLSKSLFLGLFVSLLVGWSGVAFAYSPTMTAYSSGNSTTISISGGQPNASVVINYTPSGSNLSSSVTGVTYSDGTFTTMVNSVNGSQVTATVGGQQVYYNNNNGYNGGGCAYYGCPPQIVGGFSLSQTSLNLTIGQSSSVTAAYPVYGYSNTVYIGSNSNSAVASAYASGNQATVYGSAVGSTTISVCATASGGACANLYVTVSGNSNCGSYGCGVGSLSLSQSSLSLTSGQSSSVTVSGTSYSGTLYISNNSNSSVATASLSGNQINVYGLTAGSSTISICQSNNAGSCVSLYVTVTGNISGNIYFSPSSLSLTAGQNSTVAIYNNSYSYGSYFISSNSNSSAASASLSGSSLYVNAAAAGSTSIIICQSSYTSSCATLYVTVSGVLGANTNLWFSPASPTMYVGQSLAVSINSSAYAQAYPYNNNTAYYISTNSNSSSVTASVSGSALNLYANQNGYSSITVCNSSLSFCGTIYVTVSGGSGYGGALSLSQNSVTLNQGQTVTVTASNVPALYVSSNSNSSAVSVSIYGAQAAFYGQNSGSGTVVLCGISSSQCGNVYFTVNNNYALSNVVLSQYSLAMNVGQSASVNASGAGGYGYYISSNSNPGAVSASFNGSQINLYGLANGSSTIGICQNSASQCASLSVTVGNGYSYNSGPGIAYANPTVLGARTYQSGQLISEGSTVYIVYKNTKTAFSSASAFLGLGFKFGNVVPVGNSGLAYSGYTVTTSYGAHPWGSWVKSGQTVYFVSDSGLIPVPNWNILAAEGGLDSMIVPANIYDFRLIMLSPMTLGDLRLQ